jgi:hypothetical protein
VQSEAQIEAMGGVRKKPSTKKVVLLNGKNTKQ